MKLFTIGLYGFTEAAFFDALQQSGVDTFCDVRWRRGVRGSQYAFANSARLQRRLSAIGIPYLHLRHLAPSPALRAQQAVADKAAKIPKRKRTSLSENFVRLYHHSCLADFTIAPFLQSLGPNAHAPVLFCVEREPAACHRSLLAERLRAELATSIELHHILPP